MVFDDEFAVTKDRGRERVGLMYFGQRYYNPTLQRFASQDPIGFAGGDVNLYAYVSNKPISYADPNGEFKSNPAANVPSLLKYAKGLYDNAKFIEQTREMCRSECDEGQHGGSMQQCAIVKTAENFEKCLDLAIPLK